MPKNQAPLTISDLKKVYSSGAGYDILRYISLPEILGKESKTILYYMGKNLARNFHITSLEDVYMIFQQLGWGNLELFKEKKKKMVFHLMADSVALRLQSSMDVDFRLEAGFLAESIQTLKNLECECIEEVNKRIHQVTLTIIYTDM